MMKKKLLLSFAFLLFFIVSFCQTNPNHVRVNGYYRSNGTYVKGYYRTAPNYTNRDNFSTKGNYNPYTGKAGWIEPDNKGRTQYSYSSSSQTPNSYTPKYACIVNELGQRVIRYTNGREIFELCSNCNYISYKENLEYWWYSPEKGIKSTEGKAEGTLLHGTYMFLNESNKLMMKANFFQGLLNGDKIFWDDYGNVTEKFHYSMGVADYAKYGIDDDYTLEFIGELFEVGSKKNTYNPKGLLVQRETVIKPFTFKVIQYFNDGQTQASFTRGITDDFFSGEYLTYYENGRIKFHGHFNDEGYRNGTWNWYKEDGTIEYQDIYRFVQGMWSNGEIKHKGSEIRYSSDEWRRHGKWFFYDATGEFSDYKEYEQGIEKETVTQ